MQCFYHPDQSAIGTCKVCSKGICGACAADLDHAIACKDKHEQRAIEIDFIVAKSAKALYSSKNMTWAAPAFYLFLAALFAGAGLFWRNETDWFLVLFGAGCFMFAAVMYLHRRAVWGKEQNNS